MSNRNRVLQIRVAVAAAGMVALALDGHAQTPGPAVISAPSGAATPAESTPVGSITGKLLDADGAVPKQSVVYLEGVPVTSFTVPKEHVLVSQRGARFRPDFVAAVVNQTVDMPNDDRIIHNVFSVSPVKKFDLGHYGQGEFRSVRFEKPGVVELFCNIHESMQAVIVIVPSPYFVYPSGDGSFTLSGVPVGKYQLVSYSPQAGGARTPVEVRLGEVARQNQQLSQKGR